MRGNGPFCAETISTCTICSFGTVNSSAVSAFDSVAVNEVILDSDSPGPELQPVRERLNRNPAARTGAATLRSENKRFMAGSLYPRPGASVRAPACNWQVPDGKQAD